MKIVPYMSVGSLKLQMTTEEISSQLKEEPVRFLKSDEDEMLSDSYQKAGVRVYYKEDGKSEAIELTDENNPEVNGIHFMKMASKKAKSVLEVYDDNVIEISDVLISNRLGISLYIPYDKVETVMIFEKGYYDEMLELLAEMEDEI